MNKKIRKGIWYIKNGKVPPFWKLLPSKYDPEEIEHNFLKTVDSSCKAPSYIGSDVDLSYDRSINDGKSNEKYFSTITGYDDELHLEIDPDYKIKGCYFQLLNPNEYKEVNINSTGFLDNSDEELKRQTRFQSGKQMKVDSLPVLIEFDKEVDILSIDIVGINKENMGFSGEENSLSISTPSLKKANPTGTPIFLISIDTFRYDHLDIFEDLKSMFNNAIVPEEPRTQGRYTRPSHASTITGTHPGTHGYNTGFGRQIEEGVPVTSISPDLITLPEVLTENGYTCGATTAWHSVDPQHGFGRGFQEFRVEKRDWNKYKRDSDTVVNRALEWTERMIDSGQQDIFYFMHIFDAHLPYLAFKTLTEEREIDVSIADKFKEDYINAQPLNYEMLMEYSANVEEPEYIDELKQYYTKSLENVSKSIERFVHMLAHYEILDDSLVIIAGDHGEEFLEEGVAGHATLRDTNVRPGMIIKPPVNTEFFIPDEADLIDILPTISDYITGNVPDQCAGESWVQMDSEISSRTRITEAFTGVSTYAIAVEQEKHKGIFAFNSDIPSRPTASEINSETKYEELITDESGGESNSMRTEPQEKISELRDVAIDFIQSHEKKYSQGEKIQMSTEAIKRLEDMGYK